MRKPSLSPRTSSELTLREGDLLAAPRGLGLRSHPDRSAEKLPRIPQRNGENSSAVVLATKARGTVGADADLVSAEWGAGSPSEILDKDCDPELEWWL